MTAWGDCGAEASLWSALPGTIQYAERAYGNAATNGDFKRSVVEGIFPAQESLVKAIRALAETDISGIETENGVKYTIDEMTIMVYYDKSAKLITGIETEKDGRRFDFTVVGLEPYEGQSSSEG
jgi:hypothetical protein